MADGSRGRIKMFTCPNCGALYQLVRAEGGPEAVQDEPTCGSCGSPFPARAGKFVLKYFMLRHAARTETWKRPRLRKRILRSSFRRGSR
jgi:hypothetical protein